MNIVHITNSLRGGGIQNFLLSLLPEQVMQGHKVWLIVIEKFDYDYCNHLAGILRRKGVSVICLEKIKHNRLSMLKTIYYCRRNIKKIAPDIVNTHGEMSHIYGVFSVLYRKIHQVITVHNAPEIWPKSYHFFCRKKPLIFCSEAAYDMRRQKSIFMRTIENGVSPSIVKTQDKVDLRQELSLKETDKVIVLVGSLRPQKNYIFLKQIVDEAKDSSLHFCICGGSYGAGYISKSEFNGYENNIHLLGLRSDVSAIENTSDLFLSCALFEGLPIAVLEAYFNGIPCVLSPIPQHKNIANVDKVWIPESFEPKEFIIAIYNALNEKMDHEVIFKRRESQIMKYAISTTCQKYISFYKDVFKYC
ncbi:MAG: glycosyltransferase [Bacteroidetes bacterium]|uniref:Glycosyltransferase n=1 Tax=Candidatus Cryptobacteroides excrementipullorum TaxID=2840761 RepID=A0A9D9IUP2_9BACT|nr:glycosyltransferase [Candidatus Cryptobacteroides excrementipullorum]